LDGNRKMKTLTPILLGILLSTTAHAQTSRQLQPSDVTTAFATQGGYFYSAVNPSAGSSALSPYGPYALGAYADSAHNSIVGYTLNDGSNPTVFPTGVTGIGVLNQPGSQAFGLFGSATQTVAGVATNELNTFNNFAAPSSALPPNRAIGITNAVPVTLSVAAGGSFQSSIGIQLGREGSTPNSYLTGIYVNPDAVTNYGLFIDAQTAVGSQGPTTGAVIKNYGTGTNLQLQTSGPMAAGNAVLTVVDNGNTTRAGIKQNGDGIFNNVSAGGFLSTSGNNSGAYPSIVTAGLAAGWNFSAGGGEIDSWNTYTSAVQSFAWYQMTGASAATLLMQLNPAGNLQILGGVTSNSSSNGIGYTTGVGAGAAVTQITSRTTTVALNRPTGAITMFSAAGSATAATFTVTNSTVAATDAIVLNQKSGTNLYNFIVTTVAAGSFNITFYTTGGTATDAPVINFAIIKGSAS
jgi:hypothetical protein